MHFNVAGLFIERRTYNYFHTKKQADWAVLKLVLIIIISDKQLEALSLCAVNTGPTLTLFLWDFSNAPRPTFSSSSPPI